MRLGLCKLALSLSFIPLWKAGEGLEGEGTHGGTVETRPSSLERNEICFLPCLPWLFADASLI